MQSRPLIRGREVRKCGRVKAAAAASQSWPGVNSKRCTGGKLFLAPLDRVRCGLIFLCGMVYFLLFVGFENVEMR